MTSAEEKAFRQKKLKEFNPHGLGSFLSKGFAPKDPLVKDLLHRRDLVCLAARRRHGKTTLALNLAVSLAEPGANFLNYEIPESRRTLLILVEDDPSELQEKLKGMVTDKTDQGLIQLVTREDFYQHRVKIDAADEDFQALVTRWGTEFCPHLVVFDNLAHLINAEYNDAPRVHTLTRFTYDLARHGNSAIILIAHPRKEQGEEQLDLEQRPEHFFESVMGSSQLVNSTGSLWGLQRKPGEEYSVFLGGRQRGDGNQQISYVSLGDDKRLHVVDNAQIHFKQVMKTDQRQKAWGLLPNPPASFTYSEGQALVKSALSSSSSYQAWMHECRRLRVVLDARDGRLTKAPSVPPLADIRFCSCWDGKNVEVNELWSDLILLSSSIQPSWTRGGRGRVPRLDLGWWLAKDWVDFLGNSEDSAKPGFLGW